MKALKLRSGQLRHLICAILYLARARAAFSMYDTRHILTDLSCITPRASNRAVKAANNGSAPCPGSVDTKLVGWAIQTASSRVPWRADCLIQAMAAVYWLRRHDLTPEFHLGIAQSERQNLVAHAWVSLRGQTIVGGTSTATKCFVPILTPKEN